MPCKPGDVILVRFPFSDHQTTKKRPAIVVSPELYHFRHGDIIALGLTTKKQTDNSLRLDAWQLAGLPRPTWVKPVIGTFSRDIITKNMGTLPRQHWSPVQTALSLLIDNRFWPTIPAGR